MKRLLFLALLTGCGGIQVPNTSTTQGTSTNPDTSPPSNTTVTTTSPTNPVGNGAGSAALAFTANQKIDGVKAIVGATLVEGTLYFTAQDLQGNMNLGIMNPGDPSANLVPFGQINDSNVFLKGNLFPVGNTRDSVYLGGYNTIIQIDKATLKAVGQVTTDCSIEQPWTFEKDGHWELVWNSTITTCGLVDGADLDKRKPIINQATGNALPFDASSMFTFDGTSFYQFDRSDKRLVVYDGNFRQTADYSTGGYLYNSPSSVMVSDGGPNMFFLGCDRQQDCFVTTAEVTQQ